MVNEYNPTEAMMRSGEEVSGGKEVYAFG